jgi:hypothetical protein
LIVVDAARGRRWADVSDAGGVANIQKEIRLAYVAEP